MKTTLSCVTKYSRDENYHHTHKTIIKTIPNEEAIAYFKDSYDWKEVFKYAVPDIRFNESVSMESFSIDDIEHIVAYADGENDLSNWVAVMLLNDSRYAVLRAGCDYTGWG